VRTGRETIEKERERERSWISILESIGRRDVHVFTGDTRGRTEHGRTRSQRCLAGRQKTWRYGARLFHSLQRRGSQGHSARMFLTLESGVSHWWPSSVSR